MFGSPSQRSRRDWEALPEGWDELEGPPGGLGGVGRPSRVAERGLEALPEGQEALQEGH